MLCGDRLDRFRSPRAGVRRDPAIEASPEVLAFLARRRSASAMALTAPGPSEAELADLLRLAVRVPDHGKLAPWRFIILRGPGQGRLR
jgi:nitroreductase